MVKKLKLGFVFLCSILLLIPAMTVHSQQVIELIEYLPGDYLDVAVSADGRYVAAVNNTHLIYYSLETESVHWSNSSNNILSVIISADGEYVVVGFGFGTEGGISYFNESTTRTGDSEDPTWYMAFDKVAGRVERNCMDISDDGEYVAVAGTGTSVYYFANSTLKRGEGSHMGTPLYNWTKSWTSVEELLSIDMTPDGRYLVAGGYLWDDSLTLGYINASARETGTLLWTWVTSGMNGTVWDTAISDDGNYSLAGLSYHEGDENIVNYGVRYWGDSYNLAGDNPEPLWWYNETEGPGMYVPVDMSGNGSSLITGDQNADSVYYWVDATQNFDSSAPDEAVAMIAYDVGISNDGQIIAFVGDAEGPVLGLLDFQNEIDELIPLSGSEKILSMSRDGSVIAICGSDGSLYLIRYLKEPVPPHEAVGGTIIPGIMMKALWMLSLLIIIAGVIIFKGKFVPVKIW
jgi:hypothetical protein